MAERVRVAVLAGGPSAEHEVSLESAQAVADALPVERYDPALVVIDRQGRWSQELHQGAVDIVFPVLHGPFGEDGVVQGHLEALGLPYVGCGVLASAVAMDKVAMRRAFRAEGIPVTPHVWFTEHDWGTTSDRRGLVKSLDWPMYVKPANMGSSIGISRVTSMAELHQGVELAFGYDRVVVVEQGIIARELTCGVLGDHDTPDTSAAVELNVRGDLLDYESKYHSDYEIATVPAALPEPIAEEVRELSLHAYRSIGCYGLARADFLYEEQADRLYLLEINTMPGFTARSVYARGWQASGLTYPDLLGRLIDLGFERSGA
ncbi:D-alanine--D-alanine ligase [Murinocardiopsis flavida]|uniref:D-alanine--D-alanine ligase n=1 Tax=Murinocardiopsis flavida TaxID=645275 RepID=A0A2P8D8V4_9ACTN|nr:D-alanine--D-alanine ligase family protein [Murinocardiopsis flavida]PSK93666.1 D-alanine--D-alanine ligase [Murinocardiopsis flavida]